MTVLNIRMPIQELTSDMSDEPDKPPSHYRVKNYDIVLNVVSIGCHIFDVFFDLNVAYQYFKALQYEYFALTIGFILVPALINTIFSIRMYVQDGTKDSISRKATKQRVFCILVLIFQLAPVLRYYDSIRYARKCQKAEKEKDIQKQKKNYELMLKEDSDVSLLRVIECFLEAAPQQILQITILLIVQKNNTTFGLIHTILSIVSSFVSMAWSMASYHRTIRLPQKTKNNISIKGTIMQFMWHILVTVSRILSISVIASIDTKWTIAVLFIHWLAMSVWLSISEKTNFCDNKRVFDMLFYGIFGLVYIFTYISLSDGKTRKKYIIYYFICFVENTVATLIWTFSSENGHRNSPLYVAIISVNFISFLSGILLMIAYYVFFHPTTKISSRKIAAVDSSADVNKL